MIQDLSPTLILAILRSVPLAKHDLLTLCTIRCFHSFAIELLYHSFDSRYDFYKFLTRCLKEPRLAAGVMEVDPFVVLKGNYSADMHLYTQAVERLNCAP